MSVISRVLSSRNPSSPAFFSIPDCSTVFHLTILLRWGAQFWYLNSNIIHPLWNDVSVDGDSGGSPVCRWIPLHFLICFAFYFKGRRRQPYSWDGPFRISAFVVRFRTFCKTKLVSGTVRKHCRRHRVRNTQQYTTACSCYCFTM